MRTLPRESSRRHRLLTSLGVVLVGALLPTCRTGAPGMPAAGSDLSGTVVDERGAPVAGVLLALEPTNGGMHRHLTIRDERAAPRPQTTDGKGEFAFAQLPNGPWHLSARAADGRVYDKVVAQPQPGAARVIVPLPDTSWRSPRVVVHVLTPGGEPVANATVGVHVASDDVAIVAHDARPAMTSRTGADGTCVFADVPRAPLVLAASTGDGRAGVRLEVPRFSGPDSYAAVLVEPVGGIDAALDGADANALAGSRVRALLVTDADSAGSICRGLAWTAPVRDGRATLRDLPVGRYALVLESPQGWCLDLPRNDNANLTVPVIPWTAQVTAGNTTAARMRAIRGGVLRGRVADPAGAPIAGALVVATFARAEQLRARGASHLGVPVWRLDGWTIGSTHPVGCTSTTTDANGDYAFAGLAPGLHQVEISASGHTFAHHDDVAITAEQPARLDERLGPAGAVQGVCTTDTGAHLAAIAAGGERPTLVAILPNPATFTLPGLAPGDWTLASWRYDDPKLTPLGTVHVAAGRTSWIDLRGEGGARIAGRVLDAHGKAVAGTVELRSQLVLLQRDGSFELALSKPLDQWPEPPYLAVRTANGEFMLPVPNEALGATTWRGDFVLGDCSLAIEMRDADGRAISGTVWLSGPQLSGATIDVPSTGTARHDLFAGHYRLSATTAGALLAPQELDLPTTTKLTLTAAPAARVDVRVLDRGGRIVPYRHVVLQAPSSAWRTLVHTGEGGVAHGLVPPGPVHVTLERWDGRPPPSEVDTTAVLGTPQQVTLRLKGP